MTTPLIYTSMGNMPVDELEYNTYWEDTSGYTKLTEVYKFDGKIVRESVHVLAKQNLDLGIIQEKI